MRRFHRGFGLLSAAAVLLAAVTGLLWAYAPHLYWAEGYKEKKAPLPAPAVDQAALSLTDVIARARAAGLDAGELRSISLRRDFGRILFDVRGPGEEAFLLDAESGLPLSPLDEATAILAGRQYVPEAFTLERVDFLDSYVGREGKNHGPVARVRFKERGGTEIFLHRRTGELIEDQDRVRRFHFWIMRLHKLAFFGFKKELTAVPALSILTMLLSGLWLARRSRRARRRAGDALPRPHFRS